MSNNLGYIYKYISIIIWSYSIPDSLSIGSGTYVPSSAVKSWPLDCSCHNIRNKKQFDHKGRMKTNRWQCIKVNPRWVYLPKMTHRPFDGSWYMRGPPESPLQGSSNSPLELLFSSVSNMLVLFHSWVDTFRSTNLRHLLCSGFSFFLLPASGAFLYL